MDAMLALPPPEPRTFERCALEHALVVVKDGSVRAVQGGWTFARCANCMLALWVPKGGSYELAEVCRQKEG